MADEVIRSGRRFIFTKPDELATEIKNYFDLQDPHTEQRLALDGENSKGEPMFGKKTILTKQRPYTVTGLARHLKVSRETLRNYRMEEHYSDDISEEIRKELIATIEDAVQRVEEYNEGQLHKSGLANGIKFNLVNNFKWIDKQVVETTTPEDDLDKLDDDGPETVGDEAAAALAAEEQPGEESGGDQPGPAPTE